MKVLAGIIAAAVLLVILGVRCVIAGGDDAQDAARDRVMAEMSDGSSHTRVADPEPATSLAPIEFTVAVGDKTYDVVPDQPIRLDASDGVRSGGPVDNNITLELDRTPTWTGTGDGFHFRYASSVSVAVGEVTTIAAIDGAVLKLLALDDKLSEADASKEMAKTITGSSTAPMISETTPVTRTIAGAPVAGTRYRAVGMDIDVFAVRIAKGLYGVMLYHQDLGASLARLHDLLASIKPGTAEPEPMFTVRGSKTPLYLGRAAEVAAGSGSGAIRVTLERRPLVRRTFIGNNDSLTLEYPVGVSVTKTPNPALLAVNVQSESVAVGLFVLPYKTPVDELKQAVLGAVRARDAGEVTRTHGDQTFRGRRMLIEAFPVETELYVFERGRRTIGAAVQYRAGEDETALALAQRIMASVQ